MTNGQELQIIDATAELVVRREPAAVLEEAQVAAKALMSVVSAKPRKVVLNGEQYLELEDWQTVARFYGVTAKVVASTRVDYGGGVHGFEATAVALRADGFVLSSADAACLTDEEKWRGRPKYQRELQLLDGRWVTEPVDESQHPKSTWKWNDNPRRPESRRREVGIEPVPLFQIKSMAQTRACSKVLRNVLAWVVVLAGYRPTPAEELDTVQHVEQSGQKAAPAGQEPQQASTAASGGGGSSTAPAPSQAPAAGAGTAAQTTSGSLPPGATYVKEAKPPKQGKTNDRAWTRYYFTFEDGREGVTFDTTVGEQLIGAHKFHTPVCPIIEKTSKGSDIKGLEKVVLPEPVHPDEPVTGPEKVLTVRPLQTENGTRWVIQTEKRQLVTDQETFANQATEARTNGRRVTPTFEVIKNVNKLTTLVVEEQAAAREPGQEG